AKRRLRSGLYSRCVEVADDDDKGIGRRVSLFVKPLDTGARQGAHGLRRRRAKGVRVRAVDEAIEMFARHKRRFLALDVELVYATVFIERDLISKKLWPGERLGEKRQQPFGVLGNHYAADYRVIRT